MLHPLTHQQRKAISAKHANLCLEKVAALRRNPFVHQRVLIPDERLRIGYVSSDFSNHPTSHLMQSLPGKHNRQRVEVFCYANSPDDRTTFRQKVASEAEHFTDLSLVPDHGKAADIIQADGVHILINMNGYTKGACNEIFALQPAPIQIMWLGYPGTSAARYMDYIVGYSMVTPLSMADQYEEKLAYMPHTFFMGDHKQMFPHLAERALLPSHTGEVKEKAPVKKLTLSAELPQVPDKKVEVVTPVLDLLPVTIAVADMILQGQTMTTVDGVVVQNGLTTSHTNNKAATGEEVPQNVMETSHQQYGLPETAIVYCNFDQLYKIDPLTLDA